MAKVGQQGVGNNIVSGADSANLLQFLAELRSILGPTKLITGAFSSSLYVITEGEEARVKGPDADVLPGVRVQVRGKYGGPAVELLGVRKLLELYCEIFHPFSCRF